VSLLALLFILVGCFAIGLIVARGVRRPAATATAAASADEPTCGRCGYIVRGINGLICPECGGDLREVGIVAPGLRKPLGVPTRLAIWTAVAAPPALVFGAVAASYLAPWDVTSTRGRAIFIQSPTVREVIQVNQYGRQRVMGRPAHNHRVPPQQMTLTLRNSQMTVHLASGTAHFRDANGRAMAGALDAAFIATWLNANGVSDAALPQHAADVLAAVDDMRNAGGGGFRNFSPNPARGNLPDVTAHPASPPFVVPSPIAITPYLPYALAALPWLGGLPLVLRRRGGTRHVVGRRVKSGRDADQA
jgi:hypothetical protein